MSFFQHPHAKRRVSDFEKKEEKRGFSFSSFHMIDRKEIIIVCLLRYGSWLAQNSTICRDLFAGNVVGSSRIGGILVEKEEAEDWPAFLFSQKNRRGGERLFFRSSFFRRFCLPWQRKLCEKKEEENPANGSSAVAAKAEKKYFLPVCLWENKGSGQ